MKKYLKVVLASAVVVGAMAVSYEVGSRNNYGPKSAGIEPGPNFTIRWDNAVSDLSQARVKMYFSGFSPSVPMPIADPRKVDFTTAKLPIPYLEDYTYFWELYNGKPFELKTKAQIVAKDDSKTCETMKVLGPMVGDINNPADTVGVPTVDVEFCRDASK